jgi:thiamine monophosphate kinase
VRVEAPDEKGEMVTWAVEWGGGGQLSRDGISRDTLKAGDHVIVTGNPGRNPEDHRIRMRSIKRPSDGFAWSGLVQ